MLEGKSFNYSSFLMFVLLSIFLSATSLSLCCFLSVHLCLSHWVFPILWLKALKACSRSFLALFVLLVWQQLYACLAARRTVCVSG